MAELLGGVADDYELSKEISSDYAYQLRYAIKRFERFLGRPASTDDLCERTLNLWLRHERDAGEISDRSRANVRTSVLTLWKYTRRPMNRDGVRSVVVTPKNPEAWHFDELDQVANAADRLPGQLPNGIRRADYMRNVLWFAYETGLRRRDVWTFDLTRFDSDRKAALTQHKTQRVHVVEISQETEVGIRRIYTELQGRRDPHHRTPLRWPQSVTQFYYWMKRCRELAGIDPETPNRSLQHVRRTGATEVDLDGNAAWRFLGHSREGLDRKSYIDQRKAVKPITPNRTRSDGRDRKRA